VNLVSKTPKHFSVHCGGSFPFTLVSGLGIRAGNCAGATWSFKISRNRQRRFDLDGRKIKQDQERHGRCSAARVQPKNIRNGNRKMTRPEKAKAPSYPFFLAINYKGWREKPNGWYKLSPLGRNQIGKFLPKAVQEAGLQACGKKIANHSVRKTSISRLLDGGTPENFVAQLSGHKNLQSLSSYKSASITHQRKMSDIFFFFYCNALKKTVLTKLRLQTIHQLHY